MASRSIPPETHLDYSSTSASYSRKSVSSGSNESPCSKRRPVSRADMIDDNPASDDFWALVGKYPTVELLRSFLNEAVEEHAVPPERARFRDGVKSIDKNELVARVLAYKRTRKLALDYLISYEHPRTHNKIMRGVETLKDFYIQFCEDGPRFSADAEDSKEIQEAALIGYIPFKAQDFTKKETFHIPKELYESLHSAMVANPDEISADNEKYEVENDPKKKAEYKKKSDYAKKTGYNVDRVIAIKRIIESLEGLYTDELYDVSQYLKNTYYKE